MYKQVVVAGAMLGVAVADEASLEERFRDPAQAGGGPSVVLRLDPAQGDTAETVIRQLERLRALGAGGVLVRLPVADESVWGLLSAAGAWCKKNRTELGICDFWLSAEEAQSTPRAQALVWSSRRVEGAALTTNLLPLVFGPSGTYREISRLAVPDTPSVLPHQVVDLSKGVPPSDGPWRVFWFGHADRVPELVDVYQDRVVFRHVNQELVALQSRLQSSYGTAFLWYQCAGAGAGELVWPSDIEAGFLKQGGLSLARNLPVVAGVPVGGDAAAAHVRQVLATVLREAWRSRFAKNVNDLVHESGLEAGIALGDAPIEPEEVALYFRRPTLPVARSEQERVRNERAAGAARTLGRRNIVGSLDIRAVAGTPASALLPFPFKHEVDALFGDGATRLLLEIGDARLSDDKTFVQLRSACRYAQCCQLLLRYGDPVADVLVWSRRPPQMLGAFSCDALSLATAESAAVKGGRICFDSERSYGAVAVSTEVLSEPAAERMVRHLAGKGVRVWLMKGGRAGEDAAVGKLTEGDRRCCQVLETREALGVVPDFEWRSEEAGVRVRFLHRRSSDREIYFVMNGSAFGGVITCVFRDTGKGGAERWDPLTGEIETVQEAARQADGRLSVPVYLGPHESCFVMFDR